MEVPLLLLLLPCLLFGQRHEYPEKLAEPPGIPREHYGVSEHESPREFRVHRSSFHSICQHNYEPSEGFDYPYVQLGACSPYFVRCSNFSSIEKCPKHGEVFVDGSCVPALGVRGCDSQGEGVEAVREVTQKIAFCPTVGAGVFDVMRHGERSCSQVKVACESSRAEPVAFGCPKGFVLDKFLRCERQKGECEHDIAWQYFAQLYCSYPRDEEPEEHNRYGLSSTECHTRRIVCPAEGRPYLEDRRDEEYEKRCPPADICRSGNEWLYVTLSECSNEFIFCEGLRPISFLCKEGLVFRDGSCLPPGPGCESCIVGERKRFDYTRADKFYQCEKDKHGRTKWRKKKCDKGFSFSEYANKCTKESMAGIRQQCSIGQAYQLSCGQYMTCTVSGTFALEQCPPFTRYDAEKGGCVSDEKCGVEGTDRRKVQGCREGTELPTTDCRTFRRCEKGEYVLHQCRKGEHWREECAECKERDWEWTEKPRDENEPEGGKEQIPVVPFHKWHRAACAEGEKRAMDGDCSSYKECGKDREWIYSKCVDPNTGYDPLTMACTHERMKDWICSSATGKQCYPGQRIVVPDNRHTFLECLEGSWVEMRCPHEHRYDQESGQCMKIVTGEGEITDYGRDRFDSIYPSKYGYVLPPLYEQRHRKHHHHHRHHEGAPPGTEPRDEYEQELECDGDFRIADKSDSRHYLECIKGRFHRTRCPKGTEFNPRKQRCEDGYLSTAGCVEYQAEPLPYCGEYRICVGGVWSDGRCPDGARFVNDRCSSTKKCHEERERPPPQVECTYGATKPDRESREVYYLCEARGWTRRTCDGGWFDRKTGQCAYREENPYPVQPHHECYVGQSVPDSTYSTKYRTCISGRYEERYCPYGWGFANGRCQEGYNWPQDRNAPCQESAGLRGYLADRNDCTHFYQCASGRWVRMPCAPGTHYNPRLGVCDHIGNVPECGYGGRQTIGTATAADARWY